MSRRILVFLIPVVLLPVLAGCAHSPPDDPWDPAEPVNRAMFSFNMTVDDYILRPVALGYHKITPDPVETGIGNVFHNAHAPIRMANSLLQLKFDSFFISLQRFAVNSTVGVLGIFDIATAMGMEDPDEDFGQTLGYWGMGQGPYLVLPLLGSSSGRDLIGTVGDAYVNPINYIDSRALLLSLKALYFVDKRASFLSFDQVLEQQFDPYIFMRSLYLKTRQAKVHDQAGHDEEMEAADSGVF